MGIWQQACCARIIRKRLWSISQSHCGFTSARDGFARYPRRVFEAGGWMRRRRTAELFSQPNRTTPRRVPGWIDSFSVGGNRADTQAGADLLLHGSMAPCHPDSNRPVVVNARRIDLAASGYQRCDKVRRARRMSLRDRLRTSRVRTEPLHVGRVMGVGHSRKIITAIRRPCVRQRVSLLDLRRVHHVSLVMRAISEVAPRGGQHQER